MLVSTRSIRSTVVIFSLSLLATALFAQSPKHILYWGQMQASLTADNHFCDTVELSALEFRRSLFAAPRLWNGKSILDTLSFSVEKTRVAFVKNAAFDPAPLDLQFGKKAKPGDQIRLSRLALNDSLRGQVVIKINNDTKPLRSALSYWPFSGPCSTRYLYLESFSWGAFFDGMQQDFFTADEFNRAFRTTPRVFWKPGVEPGPVEVSFTAENQRMEAPTERWETVTHATTATHLNTRHLIEPGTTVTLTLSARSHEEVVIVVRIVEPNDPRLLLRRHIDGHQLEFQWGQWTQRLNNCYLRTFTLPDSSVVYADRSSDYQVRMPFYDEASDQKMPVFKDELRRLTESRPELLVDGASLPEITFELVFDGRTYTIDTEEQLPADLSQVLNGTDFSIGSRPARILTVQNIRHSGEFDLAPYQFSIVLVDGALPVRRN